MTEIKLQKLGKDIIVTMPEDIVQKLNLEEGMQMEIESFICSGEPGIRLKLKNKE